MVHEVGWGETSSVAVLVAVGLAVSLAACGSETSAIQEPAQNPAQSPAQDRAGEAPGRPARSTTPRPQHPDAPTYASCQDLAKVFDPGSENQLSYLPDRHWLIVSPSSTAYKIDLVNDSACIAGSPSLARFVARFQASEEADQRSECQATLEQLAAGTFTVGEKSADAEALRDHAVAICEPLGIAVP